MGGSVIKCPPPSARAQSQLWPSISVSLSTWRWSWALIDSTAHGQADDPSLCMEAAACVHDASGGTYWCQAPTVTLQACRPGYQGQQWDWYKAKPGRPEVRVELGRMVDLDDHPSTLFQIPDLRTYSVPLFLRRQCDRTPGPSRGLRRRVPHADQARGVPQPRGNAAARPPGAGVGFDERGGARRRRYNAQGWASPTFASRPSGLTQKTPYQSRRVGRDSGSAL
jgi:hypothetical protein